MNRTRLIDWLGMAAAFAVLAGLGGGLLGHDIAAISGLSSDQRELAARLEFLTNVHDRVNRANAAVAQLGQRATVLGQKVPMTLDTEAFYSEAMELADRCGVRLYSIQPGDTDVIESFARQSIAISAEAEYEPVCLFLQGLQHLSRLVKIERIEITGQNENGDCEIHVNLHIFSQQNEATA